MNLTNACSVRSPSTAETPIVFVVDSDASVREALALLIRSAGWQPRTAASAEEFLTGTRVRTPSCLLVELHLPGLSGLELQKRVLDRTEMPVIFMSGRVDIPATVQAIKAGAVEFLAKPFLGDVLLHAIRHAIEQSRTEMRRLDQVRALLERYESLSRRERDVMNLVVCGRLNKQVGSQLGISEITVKAHRGRVMRKMQASSLAELVNLAANLRLDVPEHAAHTDVVADFAHTGRHLFAVIDGARDAHGGAMQTYRTSKPRAVLTALAR